MKRKKGTSCKLVALLTAAAVLMLDFEGFDPLAVEGAGLTPSAEARIGAPWTPLSYAGVARRTTRRIIRRSAIFAASLPGPCPQVTIEGTLLYNCSGTYYQSSGNQYVVVYVE